MSPAALWGITGVLALLGNAIYRLTPQALALTERALDPIEWITLVGWLAFNAYSEGYRAFHRNFSPRVVARARTLTGQRAWLIALAPVYCMGLVHATRRRLIVSWSITIGIVGIVILVRRLDQPWRGIVDAGVVVGLAWGVASIVYYVARSVRGHAIPVAPDLPHQ